MDRATTTRRCLASFGERSAVLLLSLLILGDCAFVIIHTVHVFTPLVETNLLNLEVDRSYPEVYQYIKLTWIVCLLGYLAYRDATFAYGGWALVFAYFLIDDSVGVHEWAGDYAAVLLQFKPIWGLRAQGYGELVVSAVAGIILLSFLAWAYKSGTYRIRRLFVDIALLVLLLVFCGVVVDMIHMGLDIRWEFGAVLGMVEDGGEMLSISLILWYLFDTAVRGQQRHRVYLTDLLLSVLPRRLVKHRDAAALPNA